MEFVSLILPMAVASVDRLEEPDRLRFLFDFDPAAALATREVGEVIETAGARDVVLALADGRATSARLDRERFVRRPRARQAANRPEGARAVPSDSRRVDREAGGPELDLAVPAIDQGAELPRSAGVALILGCRERADMFARVVRG